jgi:hypothetical protein
MHSLQVTTDPAALHMARRWQGLLPQALTVLALATLLAGCLSLNEKPPRAVDLSGDWELRQSLSDDPTALLRPLHHRRRHGEDRAGSDGTSAGPPPDGGGGGTRPESRGGMQGMGQFAGGRGGPDFAMLEDLLAQPAALSIRQLPTELRLTADGSPTRYVFGQDALDSVQGGIAQRNAGWNGEAFVIRYAVRQGPEALRSYQKDPTGQWLTVTTKISGGGTPKLQLRTVYERKTPN